MHAAGPQARLQPPAIQPAKDGRDTMTSTETFRTDRLVAAPLRLGDFADLRRLHGDPRVMATLSADGQPLPEEETRRGPPPHPRPLRAPRNRPLGVRRPPPGR